MLSALKYFRLHIFQLADPGRLSAVPSVGLHPARPAPVRTSLQSRRPEGGGAFPDSLTLIVAID